MDRRQVPPAPPGGWRPLYDAFIFAAALGACMLAAFHLTPSIDVGLAAAATWLVFLLFLIAAWHWLALATGFDRFLEWLPKHALPRWLLPIRSSFVLITFFFGILLGHYFWP
jgi:hypothetical protein